MSKEQNANEGEKREEGRDRGRSGMGREQMTDSCMDLYKTITLTRKR
jgi:hypothetical protein